MGSSSPKSFAFGPYELLTTTRELYKFGVRLKLRPQPFQVLEFLLERPGEVVSREELQKTLWEEGRFVDSEHGLNTAIKELRAVLSDSAAEPEFIQTIPRVGYRLIVPVTCKDIESSAEIEAAAAAEARNEAEKVQAGGAIAPARNDPRHHLRLIWLVLLIFPLGLAGFFFFRHRSPSAAPVAQNIRPTIAVLPFENLTGDPQQDYFTDGLTEEMIFQLGGLDPQHLGVIARTSVMRYKHSNVPTAAIGKDLGVEYLVEGSVRRDASRVRVSAQLIRVKDQTNIWSREYDRENTDLLVLQSEIARLVAQGIDIGLNASRLPKASSAPLTPEAYEAYDLYLRGLFFWNQRSAEGFQQADSYFQQSVQKDPNFARAYAALADSYTLESGYEGLPPGDLLEKSRAAAKRAVELDPSSAEAHTALALVAQDCDWDWQIAEREYRRAIELNPNYATAHHWYGEYLALIGRFDDSRSEFEKARQLDPLSLIVATDYGVTLFYQRNYDEAIRQFRAVIALDHNFARAGILDFAYVQKGMKAEILAELQREGPLADDVAWRWSNDAYLEGSVGQMAEAQRDLRRLKRVDERHPVDPIVFAPPYLSLKENDLAIASLEKAYAEHSISLTCLKVSPQYDPLRGDPRFQEIVRKMNFPQ